MSSPLYGWTILVAMTAGTLSGCAVPTPTTCAARIYYATEFGAAATPTDALQQFLASSDGARMPSTGWAQSQGSATQVTFRSGSAQAIAVKAADGWVVGNYTTCAT